MGTREWARWVRTARADCAMTAAGGMATKSIATGIGKRVARGVSAIVRRTSCQASRLASDPDARRCRWFCYWRWRIEATCRRT